MISLVGFGVKPQKRFCIFGWKFFISMGVFLFSHDILRKGMDFVNEREQRDWQRFLQTGQVADYLRYRRQAERDAENPRRRIEKASRYQHFY